MKVSSLFNLISDASDTIDFFEGVESAEQLVSRLERLKHTNTDELLECLDGLRSSTIEALEDTLEMSASRDEPGGDEEDDTLSDEELDNLVAETQPPSEPEKQIPAPPTPPEGEKTPSS